MDVRDSFIETEVKNMIEFERQLAEVRWLHVLSFGSDR